LIRAARVGVAKKQVNFKLKPLGVDCRLLLPLLLLNKL
jgi:hypothetical protein